MTKRAAKTASLRESDIFSLISAGRKSRQTCLVLTLILRLPFMYLCRELPCTPTFACYWTTDLLLPLLYCCSAAGLIGLRTLPGL
ncbi:hypothetical protein ANANG_G00082650 [Anguilla anguilla]|uniref:Uncharacterized protein n=1 Tax=Anguilla anguilla TaxID=7936 RepID=A0A9D3MKA6_ANGAN|nr:hypothetical protein ANANG_G00082650 [Anguilla anguilla]